jgi:hypothetical protein
MTPTASAATNTATTSSAAPAADYVMQLPLDNATVKQLDDLRRAHPNVPNRKQIIERLIWDAHAKLSKAAVN